MNWTMLCGDARTVLETLPAESVNCVVTSPPYWGLRDYGTARWDGGDPACSHTSVRREGGNNDSFAESKQATSGGSSRDRVGGDCRLCGARRIDSQIGLESSPDAYVSALVEVFRCVRRVLRDDGVVWLNLGDSYMGGGGGNYGSGLSVGQGPKHTDFTSGKQRRVIGFKAKDLVGVPWRVAFALQADGWVIRSDVVWSKANPMPESVTDRPTKSHEMVFLLSKAKWTGPERGRFADMTDGDARWMALFIDTEGNIAVKRVERNGRKWYGAQLAIASTNRTLIDTARRILGAGAVLERAGQNAPMFYLQLANRQAAALLHRIYPFLIVKRRQARIAMHLQTLLRYRGGREADRRRTPAEVDVLESLWLRNKACNHFAEPDLADVPEPKYGRWDSQPYTYDADAIREPLSAATVERVSYGWATESLNVSGSLGRGETVKTAMPVMGSRFAPENGANARTVWQIPTEASPFEHFAVMPKALARKCILAGCPPARKSCDCDELIYTPTGSVESDDPSLVTGRAGMNRPRGAREGTRPITRREQRLYAEQIAQSSHREEMRDEAGTAFGHYVRKDSSGARPVPGELLESWIGRGWLNRVVGRCGCPYGPTGVVLDPFAGVATTGVVALEEGRSFIGVELSPKYHAMARERLANVAPLLATEVPA